MSDIATILSKKSDKELEELRIMLIEQLARVSKEVKELIEARTKYGKDVVRVYFTKRDIVGIDTYNLEERTYFTNRKDVFKEVESIKDWEWKKKIKNMSVIEFIKFKKEIRK